MNAMTCGPLYKAGLESFTGMAPDKIRAFAAGFVSGQAEKVYLGACRAAMFRPSAENAPWLLGVVREVAERYGLHVEQLPTSRGVEIWLCRSTCAAFTVSHLPEIAENSEDWHEVRGALCGIPPSLIDRRFHERAGWGEACDRY